MAPRRLCGTSPQGRGSGGSGMAAHVAAPAALAWRRSDSAERREATLRYAMRSIVSVPEDPEEALPGTPRNTKANANMRAPHMRAPHTAPPKPYELIPWEEYRQEYPEIRQIAEAQCEACPRLQGKCGKTGKECLCRDRGQVANGAFINRAMVIEILRRERCRGAAAAEEPAAAAEEPAAEAGIQGR